MLYLFCCVVYKLKWVKLISQPAYQVFEPVEVKKIVNFSTGQN